jgi:hypothetical protein
VRCWLRFWVSGLSSMGQWRDVRWWVGGVEASV